MERMSLVEYRELLKGKTAKVSSRQVTAKRDQNVTSENHPQQKLFRLAQKVFGDEAVSTDVKALETRRFRLDIALVEHKVALELDGYAYHGLSKKGFQADRERDRVLFLAGWQVYRFASKEINNDPWCVIETLEKIKASLV